MGFLLPLFMLAISSLFLTVETQTWQNAKDELSFNVLDVGGNAETIRPIQDLSNTLTVNLDFNLASIHDFDDTNGFMDVSGYLNVEWTASVFAASTIDITELVPHTRMWKPPILLVNSLRQSEEIGSDSETKVRFNYITRLCLWQPWFVLRGSCSPDVKYYPFDKQECSFKFAAWGYNSSELVFQTQNSVISLNFFEENGAWEVLKTSASTTTVNDVSVAVFTISLSRRPLYHVINLLTPVIALGIVNVFTFLLPVESGERIGFSITCFLAYVVLLNTVIAFLPESSLPISYLSYYTFIMMLFSAGTSLAAIFTVRIGLKNESDKVPRELQLFIRFITCTNCTEKTTVKSEKVSQEGNHEISGSSPNKDEQSNLDAEIGKSVNPDNNAMTHFQVNSLLSHEQSIWDAEDDIQVFQKAPRKSAKVRPHCKTGTVLQVNSLGSHEESVVDAGDDRTTSDDQETATSSEIDDTNKLEEMTWKEVARIMDLFLFLCFLGAEIFYSLAYLLPIFTRD